MSFSPTSEGFSRTLREPGLVLAEIAWRWTFGLAALALATACVFAYLNTLHVTNIELLALRSHVPWLVADAIGHILYGSGPRLARVAAILLPAIFVLWLAAATCGRAAILNALLQREHRIRVSPQLLLNFLRATLTLAALIGYLGALIVAGRAASTDGESRPGTFLLVFLPVAAAISIARSRVNWFLSLAALFAARDGDDPLSALVKATSVFRRHAGAFLSAGAVFGTIHGVLFTFAAVACLLAFSLAGRLPVALTVILLATTTLFYFALCNFLCIARLATYVALYEHDRTPPAAPAVVTPGPMSPASEPPPSVPPPMAGPGFSDGSTS